jgi:hypothetical protein
MAIYGLEGDGIRGSNNVVFEHLSDVFWMKASDGLSEPSIRLTGRLKGPKRGAAPCVCHQPARKDIVSKACT